MLAVFDMAIKYLLHSALIIQQWTDSVSAWMQGDRVNEFEVFHVNVRGRHSTTGIILSSMCNMSLQSFHVWSPPSWLCMSPHLFGASPALQLVRLKLKQQMLDLHLSLSLLCCVILILHWWLHFPSPLCGVPKVSWQHNCSHCLIPDGDELACRHEVEQLAVWFRPKQPGAKCCCKKKNREKERFLEEAPLLYFPSVSAVWLHPDKSSADRVFLRRVHLRHPPSVTEPGGIPSSSRWRESQAATRPLSRTCTAPGLGVMWLPFFFSPTHLGSAYIKLSTPKTTRHVDSSFLPVVSLINNRSTRRSFNPSAVPLWESGNTPKTNCCNQNVSGKYNFKKGCGAFEIL